MFTIILLLYIAEIVYLLDVKNAKCICNLQIQCCFIEFKVAVILYSLYLQRLTKCYKIAQVQLSDSQQLKIKKQQNPRYY